MRKQDHWLHLADSTGRDRATFVAVCTFLNMARTPEWIASALDGVSVNEAVQIAAIAGPHLRKGGKVDP